MSAKNKISRPKRRLIAYVAIFALVLLAALMYAVSVYKRAHFGESGIDEMLFYATNGLAGADNPTLRDGIWRNVFLFLILSFLLLLPVVDFYRNRIRVKINLAAVGSKRKLVFNPSRISLGAKLIYAIIVFVAGLWFLLSSFQVLPYLRSLSETTQLFEEEYVDPETTKITFPKKKQNLVYIFMESMENTVGSKEHGGQADQSRIPELESIALNPKNTAFSNLPEGLGGALPATGTTWTVSGMVSQSGGVPMKNDLFGMGQNDQGKLEYFVPGAYTLGEVLQKNGYNQSFVMGSEASFGGRDKLLTQHGDYRILDLKQRINDGVLPKDYRVWWGYEDRKMFDYAKKEAERLASEDEPFNLQLLTADTHFTDGYLDPTCPTPYENQYDNVHACSSSRVAAFVDWIQRQPFGKDTTIILTGDHLGMQTEYYDELITQPNYQRTIYNAFINSRTEPEDSKGRLFTSFDMYPTTLAALGATVEGNRLGLGVNLFSDEKTLLERKGTLEALNAELERRSEFYEQKILADR